MTKADLGFGTLSIAILLAGAPAKADEPRRDSDYRTLEIVEARRTPPLEARRDRIEPPRTSAAPVDRKLLGSLEVAANVDLGVGLYSVDGARVRERAFRRAEVRTDDRTVAAVGLSLRF